MFIFFNFSHNDRLNEPFLSNLTNVTVYWAKCLESCNERFLTSVSRSCCCPGLFTSFQQQGHPESHLPFRCANFLPEKGLGILTGGQKGQTISIFCL